MLICSHFAIPFYSHLIASNYLKPDNSSVSLLSYSSLCGFTGILPDLLNIHVTLTARHNSITHTILFPVAIFVAGALLALISKNIPKYFSFWLGGAAFSHLLLDGLAGGIKPFPSSQLILGDYFITVEWWGAIDIFFLILLYITYRFYLKKTRTVKAEFYN